MQTDPEQHSIGRKADPPREWFRGRIAYYTGLGAEESEASRLAGEDWSAILDAMDPAPTAREMGRRGGRAKFARMTAAERSELGKKGAAARWGKP